MRRNIAHFDLYSAIIDTPIDSEGPRFKNRHLSLLSILQWAAERSRFEPLLR